MKNISSGIIGLLIFTMLIALVVNFHSELKTVYVQTSDVIVFDSTNDEIDGLNIAERLKNIVVLEGIQAIVNGFNPENPSSGVTDILGQILLATIGLLLTIVGVFIAPFQIAFILEQHYMWIPPFFLNAILTMLIVWIFVAYSKFKTQQGGL